jgi:hypothetical protein
MTAIINYFKYERYSMQQDLGIFNSLYILVYSICFEYFLFQKGKLKV